MQEQEQNRVVLGTLIGLAVVFGLGWLIWHAVHKPAAPPAKQEVSVVKNKLPAGWGIEKQASTAVMLKNPSNNCFAAVKYTADVTGANAPNVDHNQQRLADLTRKGFTTTPLADSTFTFTGSDGEVQVPAQGLKITQSDNVQLFQEYGYVSTDKLFAVANTSCVIPDNLPEAAAALKAVTIKHDLGATQ